MKLLLTCLFALLIFFQSNALGSLATLEAKNGFRDVKFGTPPKAYPGMYETKDSKLFGEDINKL